MARREKRIATAAECLSRDQLDTMLENFAPLLDLLQSRYMTPAQLGARWKWSDQHLANLRRAGKGPAFVRLGRSVRYPMAEVLRWELVGQSDHVTPDRIDLAVTAALSDLPLERRVLAAETLKSILSPKLNGERGLAR